MVRHISLFCFKEHPENGRTMEENIAEVRAYLETVGEKEPAVVHNQVGVTLGGVPVLPDDAPVMFSQLAQVLDFATPEDAAAYPPSKTHMDLVEFSSPYLKKVIPIDYEI